MSADGFDEAAYLRTYPDVAKAVRDGKFRSGRHHYNLRGKREGRKGSAEDHQTEEELHVGEYSLVIRPKLLAKRIQEPHTFVVGGASRGGTSSIAFALYQKNIPMGVEGTVNYEDPVFVEAVNRASFDQAAVSERISQRNGSDDVWGVKIPAASFHFARLEPMLRCPVFFMIYRNQVSVARSILNRTGVFSHSPAGAAGALSHAATFYDGFLNGLANLESPVICIEYEQLRFQTQLALDEIFGLVGLGYASEDLVDALSRPGYKNRNLNITT